MIWFGKKHVKILILTQYFPPEIGAPQNRLRELAVRLSRKGAEVSVLTAMPNYPQMQVYQGYRGCWYCCEKLDNLTVHRAYIFACSKRSLFLRLVNYLSFALSSLVVGWFRLGRFDLIVCESPPLFLGISAFLLKKIKRSKFVLNISDLWPESARELGLVTNRLVLRATTWLEECLYRNSDLITGQTQGIVRNISSRFPEKVVHWLPNGTNLEALDSGDSQCPERSVGSVRREWRKKMGFSWDDFIVLYAGIIGYAQGLDVAVKAAQRLAGLERVRFVLIGDGPVKKELMALCSELKVSNLWFFDAVSRNEVRQIIQMADVGLVSLKRAPLFLGAIPSKIFENLSLRKPILLGVEGEAKELFIDQGRAGLAFIPEDDADLAEKVRQLYHNPEALAELGDNGYRYVNEHFNWSKTADDLWRLCEKLAS